MSAGATQALSKSSRRAWGSRLLLLAVAVAVSACASTPTASPPESGRATPAGVGTAVAHLPSLRIDAPAELRQLLTQHLDFSRAQTLPEARSLQSAEWRRLLGAAPAQAQELARTLGYFNAEARIEALGEDSDSAPGRYRLEVLPGPLTRVAQVELTWAGGLGQALAAGDGTAQALAESLQADWALGTGTPFRSDQWAAAKTGVIARLRAEGYLGASWARTQAEVKAAENTVALHLQADSGPLFRAGEIQVEGLRLHQAREVQALAGFEAGETLTEARLQAYQDRLQKTGLYDQVSVSLEPNAARADAAPVQVRVREAPLHGLSLGLGTSANTGPRASVEHIWRRVGGWPVSLHNKLVLGHAKRSLDGELSTHADGQFNRDLLGLALSRTLGDTDVVISQRLRLGRAHGTTRQERLNFLEAEHSRECSRVEALATGCSGLKALTLNSQVTWRRLDNVLLPTRGFTVQTQVGGGLSDSNETRRGPFARLWGRATGYWPLGSAWYSQARVELGRVAASQALAIPDSQLFRAGGDDSVRGYAWRSLAPTASDGSVSGGRMLFSASAEIARPVSESMPAVWWAAFADAGRAADRFSDLRPAWGYGLGLRWRSPVGPLQMDWAWGEEVGRGRLHLSVGIAF